MSPASTHSRHPTRAAELARCAKARRRHARAAPWVDSLRACAPHRGWIHCAPARVWKQDERSRGEAARVKNAPLNRAQGPWKNKTRQNTNPSSAKRNKLRLIKNTIADWDAYSSKKPESKTGSQTRGPVRSVFWVCFCRFF